MGRTAVIGAGMAGLTAGALLAAEGHDVTVVEKSRGTGGRIATRRRDTGRFDHGAPHVEGGPAFGAAMAAIGAAPAGAVWRGEPYMSALVTPLERDLEILKETRATAIRPDGPRWRIEANGTDHGPFDIVLLTVPAPQLADLAAHPDLARVEMAPVWTLMAAWDAAVTLPADPPAPFRTLVPQSDRAVTAHAAPDWSAARLEEDAPRMAEHLADRLTAAMGAPDPVHVDAHRWRYARTARPLGRPLIDYGDGRLAGGDWTLGPHAGHAWESGRALAAAALSRLA